MTATKRIRVEPAKYIIYDHDLTSTDSDNDTACDDEDWLSVTTVTERVPCEQLSTSGTETTSAPTTAKPSVSRFNKYAVQDIPAFGCSVSKSPVVDEPADPNQGPLDKLRSLLQNLTAIYFVSADSFPLRFGPRSYEYWPEGVASLFKAPVQIHAPHPRETYVAICVDCASPAKVLYCDGSWKERKVKWCAAHAEAMQVRCLHSPRWKGCHNCDVARGQEIAALAWKVVQPGMRDECTAARIAVFEYGAPGSKRDHQYAHKEGCGCQQGNG